MTDRHKPEDNASSDWQGFREVDRAIAENRLTNYRWKKTWADPWGRVAMIVVFTLLVAYVGFVVVYDLIL